MKTESERTDNKRKSEIQETEADFQSSDFQPGVAVPNWVPLQLLGGKGKTQLTQVNSSNLM